MLRRFAAGLSCACAGGMILAGAAWADGSVYAMTNAIGNNQIVVWHRAGDGTLTETQAVATGGGGSGVQLDPTDSLGSQGSVVIDRAHRRLFAVNTESLAPDPFPDAGELGDCRRGTISSFEIAPDGSLTLVDRVASGGLYPDSLAVADGLLYVLNAGGPGASPACGIGPDITGFGIAADGSLTPLEGSTRAIDPGTSPGSFLDCDPGRGPFATPEFQCGLNPPAFPRSPAEVRFTPDARKLVVTVKGTNTIYVFAVGAGGEPGTPTVTQVGDPNQPTPFGFGFANPGSGALIVTEPFGATATIPAVPASAVSSYAVGADGNLVPISASVPDGEGTTCWIAVDPAGGYAYVANNATSNVSSYRIGPHGQLTLLAAAAASAGKPNDEAVASDRGGRFLYVLGSGSGTVAEFRIAADGSLSSLGSAAGLPAAAGAQGLAAY